MDRSPFLNLRNHLMVGFVSLSFALAATNVLADDKNAFSELLEMSQKEKKGLMFYVNGQAIAGAVTRIISDDLVEVKNREFGRILIRLDRVDAVAAN